ncbi:MAG: sugar ABC transporter permease [Nitrososphaeria archaeon]
MNKQVLLVLPSILLVITVGLIPTVCLINYSVQKPYTPENTFLGLEQFRKVLFDYRFVDALQRTLTLSIICLIIEILLGLGLAMILYTKSTINTVITMIITIPVLIPPITIGLLWRIMIRDSGPITFILKSFNIPFQPYTSPFDAFLTLVFMDVWHWTPLICLVLSAGLAAMDRNPVLSAKTEGATRWQIFRYIELPAIRFPLLFILLLRFIDLLKIYDEPTVIFAGGPGLTTEFISLYIRKIAIDQFVVGYGAALSLIYNFIVLVLCWLLLMVMTRGRGLS